MKNPSEILVDVEVPYRGIKTMALQDAIVKYDLDPDDVDSITSGNTVFVTDDDIAISLSEE